MPKPLIIEDEPDIRKLMRLAVAPLAFEVFEACDVQGGWESVLNLQRLVNIVTALRR